MRIRFQLSPIPLSSPFTKGDRKNSGSEESAQASVGGFRDFGCRFGSGTFGGRLDLGD
jgi:hypothetical protein